MVKFNFKKLISLFLIAFLSWSVGACYISHHESIHQSIFTHYKIKSNISINYFTLSGLVTPESYEKCTGLCLHEHFLNDLVGYYLVIIFYYVTILVLIIFLLRKNE